MTATKLQPSAPPCERGDDVIVTEQGITPWRGVASFVKWSAVSGWWVEVRTDDGTFVIRGADVELAS